MHTSDGRTVLITGAGPAGLLLGNLLLADGCKCTIIERNSRQQVESRARAGFLAAHSVRTLERHGLAAGLLTHGQRHSTCLFRTPEEQFELDYAHLGQGEIHTVYPQQNLIADLISEFLKRGGDLRFETSAIEVHDVLSDRPWILCRDAEGRTYQLSGRFIAGCDGQHGVAREATQRTAVRTHHRDHQVSWLAVLADAPPSMAAVGYAMNDRGFAGHMARSSSVTRYYLQIPRGDCPEQWPEQRVWEELSLRMQADHHGPLNQGPIRERRVVNMASYVTDPIQYGSLFLAGDAASLISPSAAKGANLAIMEAEILAKALSAALRTSNFESLVRYSTDCLPRIWRAQEFSHWMINLLHIPAGNDSEAYFLRALQQTRVRSLRTSRRHQDYFAENYVGI
ncbi:4-hydroxybenzoate 3-monooxygenase [Streptomyces flaveolus]|uniref:4-hydroxybenzoate 3-monooxygenase n=1 Tax=Streptomyces flaveolus TaxID=67297 RepID=UPI0037035392